MEKLAKALERPPAKRRYKKVNDLEGGSAALLSTQSGFVAGRKELVRTTIGDSREIRILEEKGDDKEAIISGSNESFAESAAVATKELNEEVIPSKDILFQEQVEPLLEEAETAIIDEPPLLTTDIKGLKKKKSPGIIEGIKKVAKPTTQVLSKGTKAVTKAISFGRDASASTVGNGEEENLSLLESARQWTRMVVNEANSGFKKAFRRRNKEAAQLEVVRSIISHITMDALESTDSGALVLVLTPRLEFWLHDVTLAIAFWVLLGCVPTFYNWSWIYNEKQLPNLVVVLWMIAAFGAGMEVGRYQGMRKPARDETVEESGLTSKVEAFATSTEGPPKEIRVPPVVKPQVKEGYSLVVTLLRPYRPLQLIWPKDEDEEVKGPVKMVSAKAEMFWSTLTNAEHQAWQHVGFVKVGDPLMKRLLRNPDFMRKPLKDMVKADEAGGIKIGALDIGRYPPEALEEDVVDPCFKLRGIDCFLTDSPEDDMVSHPFLLKQGLRDKPTMLINMMVQWANIIIYFELPDWITDFDEIEEQDDDPYHVKAVKRFLTGTDEFRDNYLRILPCVDDGPLPIRILAPPKREIAFPCAILPSKWNFHKAIKKGDGRILQPCLELELDIVSTAALRSMSSLLKRYIQSISMDMAIILDYENRPEEPKACLGLWRFDHIDVSSCSPLPSRFGGEALEADVRRASQVLNLSAQELAVLLEADPAADELPE